MQSHVDDCPLCDGPCREPFPLPPSTALRPFAEVTPVYQSQTEPEPEPVEPPVDPKPTGKRAKRPAEDRMRRPVEDR